MKEFKVDDILWGRDFVRALEDAEIVPPGTRRVVIEAEASPDGGVTMIYVELLGDKRLLEVSLQGAEICLVSKEHIGDA